VGAVRRAHRLRLAPVTVNAPSRCDERAQNARRTRRVGVQTRTLAARSGYGSTRPSRRRCGRPPW
jgi:hypothetical protein